MSDITQVFEGEKFVRIVREREGLLDWRYQLSKAGSMVRVSDKTILVHERHANNTGMWLHEFAHVLRLQKEDIPQGSADQHDVFFADIFTRLVSEYTGWCYPFPAKNYLPQKATPLALAHGVTVNKQHL